MANGWFIPEIAPLMQAEAKKRGYKIVSTAIAQAIIESRWGESGLAKYHNYFGLKCGSKWTGKSVNMQTKEEYKPGQISTIRDNFRVFDSMADGVNGYYNFISSSRYANLKTATTPRQYAEYLKADGYATSSSYRDTLVSTVQNYNLSQYDGDKVIIEDNPNRNPYNEPTKNVRLNSKGNDVRWVQVELNRKGHHLTVDGICGLNTVDAIKAFQFAHGLSVDGIVGSATREKLKAV